MGRRCALILLLFLLAGAPLRAPQPQLLPAPQQVVRTTLPQLCVHTRLIDEVEEWKIQRSLELTRELGATAIVEFFPWAYIEHAPGRHDWRQTERILAHARNQGLRVIARMGLVPAWARDNDPGANSLNALPPSARQEFAEFVATFAHRHADQIRQLIIWNEPNLRHEWGMRAVSAAEYAELLRLVSQSVRAVSPDTQILAAGPAPTLEPPGSPLGQNDLRWLKELLVAGAARWSDGFALHSYGFRDPPTSPPAPERLNFRRVELLRGILQQHGAGELPLMLSESGWNDSPFWTQAVSPAQRIRYTSGALEYVVERWPWLEQLCLWALRYPAPPGSGLEGFALLTQDMLPTPLYHAIQLRARPALSLPP